MQRLKCAGLFCIFVLATVFYTLGMITSLQLPTSSFSRLLPQGDGRLQSDTCTNEGGRVKCLTFNAAPTNIVFIKVHKAGSTTVSNILARYALHYDLNIALPKDKPPYREGFHCFGPFRADRVVPLGQGQTYHVLFNHMRYNRTELDKVMPKDTFYCTIMREPVSRFVSAMYYFGVLKPPSTKNVSQVSPGFSKFLSETGRKGLEVRPLPELLYNSIAFDTGLALTQQKSIEAVEQHIAKLDRELDLMMVMEYFHESLVLLKRRARLQLRDIIHVKLNSKRPRSTHLISDSDLKTLKDWQMADHKIYDHFLAKFWKEVRKEGPDFQDEVKHFQEIQTKVARFCRASKDSFDVLFVPWCRWGDAFTVTPWDCDLLTMDERKLQRLLLDRTAHRKGKLNTSRTE